MNVSSISVLICTFNRAALLESTLGEVLALDIPPGCSPEIIVVDNNSTDATQNVIAAAGRGSPIPIIALRESRQGKSFALNRGLSAAKGDVIALTDDDVWPAKDWLSRIVEDFRAHDVTFVFGKVLPRWTVPPPPELLMPQAQDVWGPLAIVDYGDEPADYVPSSTGQRLPIGANLAFRRPVLEAIGGWRTDLGKVDNTLISGEDHEIFSRLRRFGLYSGYYDPRLFVHHLVPAERLTRAYFRRWFFWHGKTHALMLDDLHPDLDMTRVPRVGGVPRFACRQALQQSWRWLTTRSSNDALLALVEELRLLQYAGLLAQCWRRSRTRVWTPPGLAR
jgi:glycosyltransferase involved in cell wall biosynthesis